LGSLAITISSLVYFIPNERAEFIIEKLPLSAENLYVGILRFHVIAAAFSLPGCLILTSKFILKRWPRFHRYCGRVIGSVILAVLVPSGFYLSFFARGGWGATLGFCLSGAIVGVAMAQGIRAARAKQYARHRRFTFHVLGQLSVAVSSRAMLFVLGYSTFDPDFGYLLSLWIPVLGTFALVEFLASPISIQSISRSLYEKTVSVTGVLRGRGANLP